MELDRLETSRRMRALRGYSLMSQPAFAQAMGVEPRKAESYMRTTDPTRAPEHVLKRAAEVAGLPRDFALGTFGAPGEGEAALTEADVRTLIQLEVAAIMRRGDDPGGEERQEPDEQAS